MQCTHSCNAQSTSRLLVLILVHKMYRPLRRWNQRQMTATMYSLMYLWRLEACTKGAYLFMGLCSVFATNYAVWTATNVQNYEWRFCLWVATHVNFNWYEKMKSLAFYFPYFTDLEVLEHFLVSINNTLHSYSYRCSRLQDYRMIAHR